ncbi:hypothetical protein MRX96_050332 [Rhipicephalus microplus]
MLVRCYGYLVSCVKSLLKRLPSNLELFENFKFLRPCYVRDASFSTFHKVISMVTAPCSTSILESKTVLSKDLCNLKRSLEESDEAELLMREIANCQNNHKAKVIAITDEAKKLQFLLVQTAHMQHGCGASQVVGYAFVASEQYHVLSKLLETFVKENPSSQETQVVVVDKDFTAINAIHNTFTSAPSVQLCQFHVVKAFGVAAGRLGRSLEEKQKMICTFKEMLHAPTMEKFEEVKADFHRYASKEAVAYFDENWGSITEMWVRHICDREFTFGDNTTNRVESHNNIIKKVLKSSSKLHEALANLLKLAGMSRQNTCHAATLLKTCNFYSYNTSHHIERQCEKVLTPYACRLVSKQLMKMEESNRAIRKTAEDKYEVASGVGDACHQHRQLTVRMKRSPGAPSAGSIDNALEEIPKPSKDSPTWKAVRGSSSNAMPEWKDVPPYPPKVESPITYFRNFFDVTFLSHICEQSSLYSAQRNPNKVTSMTVNDLEQFIGTVLTMSLMKLPQTHMYWSQRFRVSQVTDTMTRDRWEEIKQSLHFSDNQEAPDQNDPERDRLYKVRPLLDHLVAKCHEIPKSQKLCVDEQLVPFKGRS